MWFVCYVESIYIKADEKGEKRAEIYLKDNSGRKKFNISSKKFKKWQSFLDEGEVLLCCCKRFSDSNINQVYLTQIFCFSYLREEYTALISLNFSKKDFQQKKAEQQDFWISLQKILTQYPGESKVQFTFQTANSLIKLELQEKIRVNQKMLNELGRILPIEKMSFIHKKSIEKIVDTLT